MLLTHYFIKLLKLKITPEVYETLLFFFSFFLLLFLYLGVGGGGGGGYCISLVYRYPGGCQI